MKRRIAALLEKAGMDEFSWNTGVIRGDDKLGRLMVTSASDAAWGDAMMVAFMIEGETVWRYTHILPAKARLLAEHLIERANALETADN